MIVASVGCTGSVEGQAAAPALTAALAAASLIGAFALLVVPEAAALAALARLPVAVLLLDGIGGLLIYAGIGAGGYVSVVAAVLGALVAAEITIRALATLFVPFPPLADAQPVARSVLAGALARRRPQPVVAAVRDWFGMDLSRSWAIAFVRAAAPPRRRCWRCWCCSAGG